MFNTVDNLIQDITYGESLNNALERDLGTSNHKGVLSLAFNLAMDNECLPELIDRLIADGYTGYKVVVYRYNFGRVEEPFLFMYINPNFRDDWNEKASHFAGSYRRRINACDSFVAFLTDAEPLEPREGVVTPEPPIKSDNADDGAIEPPIF